MAAQTRIEGTTVHLSGDLPAVGQPAPAFTLVDSDLGEVTLDQFSGKRVVLNVFPSVDTGVCAASVRTFNELASQLENTVVVNVSRDLPFALGRFCAAEGIDRVVTASAFRSDFAEDYGLAQQNGPLQGLLARAVLVVGPDGTVGYTQLVPEITQEPDYDAVTAYLGAS